MLQKRNHISYEKKIYKTQNDQNNTKKPLVGDHFIKFIF